jgi:hypothetical protein
MSPCRAARPPGSLSTSSVAADRAADDSPRWDVSLLLVGGDCAGHRGCYFFGVEVLNWAATTRVQEARE